MIHSEEFACKSKLKKTIDKCLTMNINIWKKIRGPFIFPYRIPSHRCDTYWEKIDVDCAGCRICGNIHICHGHNTVLHEPDNSIDKAPCIVSVEHDADVCIVTGLCMHSIRFSEHEVAADFLEVKNISHPKLSPATHPKIKNNNFKSRNKSFKSMNKTTQNATNTNCLMQQNVNIIAPHTNQSYSMVEGCCVLDYASIHAVCRNILCSQAVKHCFEKEREKLSSRVRTSLMKHVRHLKKKTRNNEPIHVLSIIGDVAADLFNYRLVAFESKSLMHSLDETRDNIAEICAHIITTFINNANNIIKNFMYNVSPKTFIVGVLYLLRVGLTAHHIVLLPEQRILTHILPSENLLHEFFDVKCKCITEVENIIKLQVRMLRLSQLMSIQYTE